MLASTTNCHQYNPYCPNHQHPNHQRSNHQRPNHQSSNRFCCQFTGVSFLFLQALLLAFHVALTTLSYHRLPRHPPIFRSSLTSCFCLLMRLLFSPVLWHWNVSFYGVLFCSDLLRFATPPILIIAGEAPRCLGCHSNISSAHWGILHSLTPPTNLDPPGFPSMSCSVWLWLWRQSTTSCLSRFSCNSCLVWLACKCSRWVAQPVMLSSHVLKSVMLISHVLLLSFHLCLLINLK
jgi:hypothetical protein